MTDAPHAKACCSPSAGRKAADGAPQSFDPDPTGLARSDAVLIPGGNALVGTRHPGIRDDGESPLRQVKLKPFRIGATTVTNAEFARFIDATNYVTEAEQFGWSFVFHSEVGPEVGATRGVVGVEWWRQVEGATWRDINGPGTAERAWFPDHPVVQVSWNDARAYASWAGGRLPTEAEWEHAARGGLGDVRFPWGDAEPDDNTTLPCNIWQGQFPAMNSGADGYLTTAPARSFAPNGFGLFNLVGNVWEWTADIYKIPSLKRHVREHLRGMKGYRTSKGGSFLCHRSYCYRYRIAARSGTSPDSTTTHQGFRVVWPE
jgi:formylglycine-generating enzyme required for sulfatase activity